MFIAKNKQIDKKNKFSISKMEIKSGLDISYPFIDSDLNKKTPAGQTNKGHPTTARSKVIKTNKRKNVKGKWGLYVFIKNKKD